MTVLKGRILFAELVRDEEWLVHERDRKLWLGKDQRWWKVGEDGEKEFVRSFRVMYGLSDTDTPVPP